MIRATAHGVAFEIRGPVEPELAAALGDLSSLPSRRSGGILEVSVNDDLWSIGLDGGPALGQGHGTEVPAERLIGALNLAGLHCDDGRLHLHAGGVEREGSGVLLAGPSGAGKSTLTMGLVSREWAYLSDETVSVLPGSRTVFGFPKPITLKGPAIDLFPRAGARIAGRDELVHVRAGTLTRVLERTRVERIIAPAHQPGVSTELIRIEPIEMVHLLMAECLDARRIGPAGLMVIAELISGASCWRLSYSALDEALDAIEDTAAPPHPLLVVPAEPRAAVRHRAAPHKGLAVTLGDAVAITDPGATDLRTCSLDTAIRERIAPPSVRTAVEHERTRASGGTRKPIDLALAMQALKDAGLRPVLAGPVLLRLGDCSPERLDEARICVPAGHAASAARIIERTDPDLATHGVVVTETIGPRQLTLLSALDEVLDRSTPELVGGEWFDALHPVDRFLDAAFSLALSREVDPRMVAEVIASAPWSTASIEFALTAALGWNLSATLQRGILRAELHKSESTCLPAALAAWAKEHRPPPGSHTVLLAARAYALTRPLPRPFESRSADALLSRTFRFARWRHERWLQRCAAGLPQRHHRSWIPLPCLRQDLPPTAEDPLRLDRPFPP